MVVYDIGIVGYRIKNEILDAVSLIPMSIRNDDSTASAPCQSIYIDLMSHIHKRI
ncbi:hypothetical protein D3C85_1627710 [compost metagenome]